MLRSRLRHQQKGSLKAMIVPMAAKMSGVPFPALTYIHAVSPRSEPVGLLQRSG